MHITFYPDKGSLEFHNTEYFIIIIMHFRFQISDHCDYTRAYLQFGPLRNLKLKQTIGFFFCIKQPTVDDINVFDIFSSI